ncbi:hypothetical protein RJT34_02998 [Clitoria ternatea]|uniref:RecQ-mediated genome instability protein 1 n=1 Tax=Clitoria ternatea TaxID=43366 RepID=A0AAN9KJG4_CLITE
MSIRRLILDSDSDSDSDGEQHPLPPDSQQHTTTPTHQPPNASNFHPVPVVISDDEDFVDVSDSLSPPPQPPPASPLDDFLCRLGLALKRDWLDSCLRELQGCVPGFEGLDVTAKAKRCFEQFLFADMNSCGNGVLPPNVDSMHLRVLPGPYVLQVDEMINISCPLRGRYEQAPPGVKRCLKLSMTDGIQRVFGLEYRPIQALEVCASAGLKVAITNVFVRRGLLLLVPETIEILGGLVEQLDAARKRLVDEINKPPRGKRTKNGVLPPLATRAALAAWPSSGVDNLGHSGSVLHITDSLQANNQVNGVCPPLATRATPAAWPSSGVDAFGCRTESVQSNNQGNGVLPPSATRATPAAAQPSSRVDAFGHSGSMLYSAETNYQGNGGLPPLASRATPAAWPSSGVDDLVDSGSTLPSTNSVQPNNQGAGLRVSGTRKSLTTEDTLLMDAQDAASNSIPHTVSNAEAMDMDTDVHTDISPMSRANSMTNHLSSVTLMAKEMHIDATHVSRENSVDNQSSHILSNLAVAHKDTVHTTRETSVATECSPTAENVEMDRGRIHVIADNTLLRRSSSTASNTSDIQRVDDRDHPPLQSADQEVPFTYLANLSAKWIAMKEKAPFVRGKIKCFLTGVKGFRYKKRKTYELQAYVDDGSLISEILIDHDVVQKGIGYSPEEVTAALSSPDTKIVHQMKDTMRKFQAFLANFEGVILVELNKRSSIPLAVEMSQGCLQCDAWLLLRRLKSLHPGQVQNSLPSDPIELSP